MEKVKNGADDFYLRLVGRASDLRFNRKIFGGAVFREKPSTNQKAS
jgi:hypothetical protein